MDEHKIKIPAKSRLDKLLDSTLDFIFSKDPRKWLILIVFLGAILRFLVARNISALGDEMVHGPHAIGFLHSGLISTFAHSPLWFYLTDIVFKFFNVTMFSARFLSFFYGTLTILVIYLIASKIFNKKIGLFSAFLLSVSFFTIRYTLMEMDLALIFFLVSAIYFFLIAMEKGKFPWLAAVCIGIASLIKTLSLFFIPAFLIAFFLFKKEKGNTKKNIKNIFVFGIIILLIFMPIIIHNYLWYKDKGMVDTYAAQYFFPSLRPVYAAQLGYDSGLLSDKFFTGLVTMSKTIFSMDPLITILGILGIILAFSLKNKRKYWYFLILFQLSGFLFLVLSNWLHTHYTTMIPILCIFGGFFIHKTSQIVSQNLEKYKLNYKKILCIILILIFGFQLYLLLPHLTSRCAMGQMREYAIDDMDKNSIVLADSRIYRGRIAFLFHDFHYLESASFAQISQLNQELPGQDIPTKVYFVECVRDDCGWGSISEGPLNDSSEELVQLFSTQANLEKIIYGGGGYDEETGKPYFKVYSATMQFKPQIFSAIDSTHEWFYYPVNYIPKEKIWDNYDVYGALDNSIYKFAWLIIILAIGFAIILPIFPFVELKKSK
ncbi:glycosyltransferase family 39 protein [Candidatus Pacearchaeota archaeon]|nr:glycosyltransferase family 39 protein [Candidatus Pacearchaeota archaeon]